MYLSIVAIIVLGTAAYVIGHVRGYNKGKMEEHEIMRQQLLERNMIGEDDAFWW
jgi:hypothetical protein